MYRSCRQPILSPDARESGGHRGCDCLRVSSPCFPALERETETETETERQRERGRKRERERGERRERLDRQRERDR